MNARLLFVVVLGALAYGFVMYRLAHRHEGPICVGHGYDTECTQPDGER